MRLKDAYPHPVSRVQVIETHIARVILTGRFAYKIKKAVNFSFVDFSTLGKRKYFCDEQARLNQRLGCGPGPLRPRTQAPAQNARRIRCGRCRARTTVH